MKNSDVSIGLWFGLMILKVMKTTLELRQIQGKISLFHPPKLTSQTELQPVLK